MRKALVSFTLHAPETMNDYEFFYLVLDSVAVRWIRRDETEILIETPYSDALLRETLGMAIDPNDTLNVYGVVSETGINQVGTWRIGGLGDPASLAQSRQLIQKLAVASRLKAAS